MPKTSIYLTDEDKEYCLEIGKNLSDGIRKCISYKRETSKFKQDLELVLKTNTFTNTMPKLKEVSNSTKNKVLKLMEM